jgi:hypothetical protein
MYIVVVYWDFALDQEFVNIEQWREKVAVGRGAAGYG